MRIISVVVPVYNEQQSIAPLCAEIAATFRLCGYSYETIFVDDGSTDLTWEAVRTAVEANGAVRGVRFVRNFGKASALAAGFAASVGDIVITMDGDIQDDPAEIPRFIAKLEEGYEIVCGWKRRRHDPRSKVVMSRIFNYVISRITGVRLHDHNCGFKAYKAEALRNLRLDGNLHRFLPVLLAARGHRCAEIEVHHRPRLFGVSKYGTTRLFSALFDLLTVLFITLFQRRPMYFFGGVGSVGIAFGLGGHAYLIALWLLGARISDQPLLTYSASALFLGFQLFATGLLAELVTWHQHGPSRSYVILDEVRRDKRVASSAEDTDPAGSAEKETQPR